MFTMSLMQTVLFSQRDAPFAVLSFLCMNDIASLHACARIWHDWINTSPLKLDRMRTCTPAMLPLVFNCAWAKKAVTSYTLLDGGYGEHACTSLRTALCLLTTSKKVDILNITTRVATIKEEDIQHALRSFTQLYQLDIRAPPSLLCIFFKNMHFLTSLIRVEIIVTAKLSAMGASPFDFSPLALLPHLNAVTVKIAKEFQNSKAYRISQAQVCQLAACNNVSELSVGSWNSVTERQDENQFVGNHLGHLVRSVLARPSLMANYNIAPLDTLDLTSTIITPAIWHYVSMLTDLVSLDLLLSPEFSATAEWGNLKFMKQLSVLTLRIEGNVRQQPPALDSVIAALPPTIEDLTVGMNCKRSGSALASPWYMGVNHMKNIVQALPDMLSLSFIKVTIEDNALIELASAVYLDYLCLKFCSETKNDARALRITLPSLQHLTSLVIKDTKSAQLTEAEAEPLRVSILSKCPQLSARAFVQNVL